jgi:hypothetical protein
MMWCVSLLLFWGECKVEWGKDNGGMGYTQVAGTRSPF